MDILCVIDTCGRNGIEQTFMSDGLLESNTVSVVNPISANRFGWFKAERYQEHGVVCETSIIQQPSTQKCQSQRKLLELKNYAI